MLIHCIWIDLTRKLSRDTKVELPDYSRIALTSHMKNGHTVCLWGYQKYENVPYENGGTIGGKIILRDLAEIEATSTVMKLRKNNVMHICDWLRIRVLENHPGLYLDIDIISLRDLSPLFQMIDENGGVYGSTAAKHTSGAASSQDWLPANGLIGTKEKGCPVLRDIAAVLKAELMQGVRKHEKMMQLTWKILKKHGRDSPPYRLDYKIWCPIPHFASAFDRSFFGVHVPTLKSIQEDCLCVHIWNNLKGVQFDRSHLAGLFAADGRTTAALGDQGRTNLKRSISAAAKVASAKKLQKIGYISYTESVKYATAPELRKLSMQFGL